MKHNLDPKDKKAVGFYLVTNEETAETYAGSGILGARYRSHLYLLERGVHPNPKLQAAYNRNPEGFEFLAVPVNEGDYDASRDLAFDFEQDFIDEHKSNPLLLNLATDARRNFNGSKHTEESKQLNRVKTSQRWQDPEWREKVLEAQAKGKAAMTPEERRAMVAKAHEVQAQMRQELGRSLTKGQSRPESFKEHDSRVITAKWQDPAYRAKQIAARAKAKQEGRLDNGRKKPCRVEGVVYESVKDAATALGMSTPGVIYRIETGKPGYEYL